MDFDVIRVSVLALLQGLTEFLPISSSAHLIFPSALLGWEDQGLAFDVAVHLGTLSAVIWYFRDDLHRLFKAWSASITKAARITKGEMSEDARQAWLLILATMPLIATGFMMRGFVDENLRNTAVIATTSIVFGIVLWLADRYHQTGRGSSDLGWKGYLFVGVAQVFALIPGTSRSGVTTSAALFLRLGRKEASRLSFLLSIPAIGGASLLLFIELLAGPAVNWFELIYAMVFAGIVAYLCIHYFLKLIEGIGFLPFVIYRLVLGVILFIFFV